MKKAMHLALLAALPHLAVAAGPATLPAPDDGAPPEASIHWAPAGEPGNGGAVTSLRVDPRDPSRLLSGGDMLGMALSTDRGETWRPTFGFAGYEVADVTFHPTDPSVAWCGAMSGPHVSTDGGAHWQSRREGMPPPLGAGYSAPVEKVLIDPIDAKHLLAFDGSSRRWGAGLPANFGIVWESRDGGAAWSRLCTITDGGSTAENVPAAKVGKNIVAAEFASNLPTRLYALADAAGVYVSEDSGKTWQKRTAGLPATNVQRLAVHPSDPDHLWLTLGAYKLDGDAEFRPGGVYESTDAAKSWHAISNGLSTFRNAEYNLTATYNALAVSPVDPKIMWTNEASWNTGVIYKSEDGGRNWKPVATKQNVGREESDPARRKLLEAATVETATPAGLALSGLTADPKDPDVCYGFGTEFILRTTDGGRTWTDITAYRPDRKHAPGVWRGRGWTGWCATNVAFNPYRRGQVALQGMDACKLFLSDDGLRTFRSPAAGENPWLGGVDCAFARGGHIYLTTGQFGGNTGIWHSSDGGKTFQSAAGAECGLPAAGWGGTVEGGGVYADPDHGDRAWAVMGGVLYHTADGGANWAVADDARGFRFLAGDPTRPGRFYAAGREGVFVTDDGKTFTNIAGPAPAGRGRINCDSQGRVYACQWRDGPAGVWRYDPASKQWARLLDEPLAVECVADPSDPNRLLLVTSDDPYHDFATGHGVWISPDAGRTWKAANDELPMLRATAAAFDPFDPTRLVIGTFGRGFWTARWPRER